MTEFEEQLLRLKQALQVIEDRDVAEALGMSKAAFSVRKARGAFPAEKVYALQARRPELKIDAEFVLTGREALAVPAAPIDIELHTRAVEAVAAELARRGMQLSPETRSALYRAVHDMSAGQKKVNAKALSALVDVALAAGGNYSAREGHAHQTTFHAPVGAVHSVHEGEMTVVHGRRGTGKSKLTKADKGVPPKGG